MVRVGLGSEECPGGKPVQRGFTESKERLRVYGFHNFILNADSHN